MVHGDYDVGQSCPRVAVGEAVEDLAGCRDVLALKLLCPVDAVAFQHCFVQLGMK